ncbi:hypothetical protein AC1031_008780 [Aphanomyces cochlioides]|nr:hypothetical protein AC1031_008780 [Aphanomyces cochlioides]
MWAIIFGIHLFSFFVNPYIPEISSSPYVYVMFGLAATAIVLKAYSTWTQPGCWKNNLLPMETRVALCFRLFGYVWSNDVRRWRNDAVSKLSTVGFTTILATIAATVFISPYSPLLAFVILVLGVTTATILDELRECVDLMKKVWSFSRKTD